MHSSDRAVGASEIFLMTLKKVHLRLADPHPGNIAVDAIGGGRLIYYDFGECCSVFQCAHVCTRIKQGGSDSGLTSSM